MYLACFRYCFFVLHMVKGLITYMKKLMALLLATVFLGLSSTSVFANESAKENVDFSTAGTAKRISVVMAINEEVVLLNGVRSVSSAPILVLDKTYVDLYAVAPLMEVNVQWIEDYIGFFRVSAEEKSCDFTLISQWEDLVHQKHKFFVKDSTIFVSLRELCELAGQNITYTDGVITIGNQYDFDSSVFGTVDTYDFDEYIYTAYPYVAEHVVYPYEAYGYETMLKDAKKLQHKYSDLVKTSSIGKSVEGRDLLLIEFGRGTDKIFVCGAHHAREYISTTYLMYAIDRYAYAYRSGSMWGQYNPKDILDEITFCIVPMVNPDGVNLVQNGIGATMNPDEIAAMGIYGSKKYGYSTWKANVHGVDINWNYDKDWSPEKNKNESGSEGFNGDYPNSEPETVAVSNYVDSHSFDAFLSFHTQGQIFYWADNTENPTYLHEVIKKDTGFIPYKDAGEGVGGSFFDYVYRKFNKPTITVELCPYIGDFPYPDEKFDTVWKPAKNILLAVGNEIIYNKLCD